MNARLYKSSLYKIAAVASHIATPSVWPVYQDRIKRRLLGKGPRHSQPINPEEVYGPHIHSVEGALHAVGLSVRAVDPSNLYKDLFEDAHARIRRLRIPFQDLGIAGAADLSLIFSAALAVEASDILETGVALGWSSLVLLKVAEETNGRLVSIDLPYPFLIGDAWVGVVVPNSLRERWTLLRKSDQKGLPRAMELSDGYDLIHYDSDKSVVGRQWAYPRLWNSLRPGGLLLSDDIGDNRAWWNFCVSMGVPVIAVRRERAISGLARKPFTSDILFNEEAA